MNWKPGSSMVVTSRPRLKSGPQARGAWDKHAVKSTGEVVTTVVITYCIYTIGHANAGICISVDQMPETLVLIDGESFYRC